MTSKKEKKEKKKEEKKKEEEDIKQKIQDNLMFIINEILPNLNENYILTDDYNVVNKIHSHTEKNPVIRLVRSIHFNRDALHFNIKISNYYAELHVYIGISNDSDKPFIPLLITDPPYTISYLQFPGNEDFLSMFIYSGVEEDKHEPDAVEIYTFYQNLIKSFLSPRSV